MLKSLILIFAFVGLIAAGMKLFRSKMGLIGKSVAGLVLLGLAGGMLDPHVPLVGLFNPIAALFATGGIFIVGYWIVTHKKLKKQPWPRGIGALVCAATFALIWWPVLNSPPGTLPVVPNIGISTPAVLSTPPPSAVAPTPSFVVPAPRTRRPSMRTRPNNSPCADLPYQMQQYLGCP